ncbi:33 kDa chaperonin [compost metagenome]
MDEILATVLGTVKVLDSMELSLICKCSREKVKDTLISLGTQELERLVEEDGQVELRCHYCNEAYLFQEPELRGIIEHIGSAGSN